MNTSTSSPSSRKRTFTIDQIPLSDLDGSEFLMTFDTVVIFCEGVLWKLGEDIPAATRVLKILKDAGKKIKFISNSTFMTKAECLAKLSIINGRDVSTEDLLLLTTHVLSFLKKNKKAKLFSLASSEMNEMLRKEDIQFYTMKPNTDVQLSNIKQIVVPPDNEATVNAIYMDLNLNISYAQMMRACWYLKSCKGCQLYVGGGYPMVSIWSDYFSPGMRGITDQLREAGNQKPTILGNPSEDFHHVISKQFRIKKPENAIFICKEIWSEVKFAQDAGYQTVLIAVDRYNRRQLNLKSELLRPQYVARSMADFERCLEKKRPSATNPRAEINARRTTEAGRTSTTDSRTTKRTGTIFSFSKRNTRN